MEEKEKILNTPKKPEAHSPETNQGETFLKTQAIEYKIGEKSFLLQTDFTYQELEWLDVVYDRVAKGREYSSESNEIRCSFTRNEIEKTLKLLLVQTTTPLSPPYQGGGIKSGRFMHEDFLKTRESQTVKIIADFFLMRAVSGYFIKNSLTN